MEPGLESTHVMQVPTGGTLPKDGRVQMYPCHSFEFHVVLMAIDPALGKPEIRRYVIGHDCGTVINPHIVKGMTLGGLAHGLGAALLEEFVYDDEGHLMTQSFMDYLLPSAHEVPEVEIVHHCTPSPFTVFGQKGSGESGYLGAPAAIVGRDQRLRVAARHFLQQAAHSHFRHRRRHRRRATRQTARASHMIIDCHAHLVPPSLLESIRSQAATVSVDPPDRGRRQPRVLLRRRQADPAGVETAERSAGPPEMDGRAEDRAPGGRRLARHVRLRSCRRRRARPGRG